MATKEGFVKVVAKTGGIKFDGEDVWYNPISGVKPNLEWKNKYVILALSDNGKNEYTAGNCVKPVGMDNISEPNISVRQTAIKCATELVLLENNVPTPDELKKWAEEIEKWILR